MEYDDGTIAVLGLSNRPAEAARMGYLPRHRAPAARATATPAPRPPRPRPAVDLAADPFVVADRLLESLLDEGQLATKRRHGRWWVEVDRGWLQMGGSPHDIRFRPDEEQREWSLCVVAADRTLPPGDVWSTLLLTATATPDTFFRVANWSTPVTSTPAPTHPPT